jgi:NitT/TauT family transport system ATP-binding protein
MSETIIDARAIEKFYGSPEGKPIQVIAPTDISIHAGEIVALLGPSGSGKSTLLRILTGLSKPSAGEVLWHGQPFVAAQANVSIVFQSFALFPWLTVLENVEAALKAKGMSAVERRKRSLRILDSVGLDGFEQAYPKELSGGMKQRVGMARAIVVEPEVIFMDEAFSALDVLTAENLRSELLDLWQSKRIPTRAIFIVTHNIHEAVSLADRIIVLGKNPGKVRTDFRVSLPHPRDEKAFEFSALVDYVYKVLTRPEAPAPVVVPAETSSESKGAGAPQYQMLPHARPGGIAGLLEILAEHQGPYEMHALADDLAFELDDLLPIVDASAMLGFLTVAEGKVDITPEGRKFADADIIARKEIFRDRVLERITLIRQIGRALASKSDKTISDEFFYDILDEHFSEQEAKHQLDTAVHWGRYAEVFDYDANAGKFYIPEENDARPDAAIEVRR